MPITQIVEGVQARDALIDAAPQVPSANHVADLVTLFRRANSNITNGARDRVRLDQPVLPNRSILSLRSLRSEDTLTNLAAAGSAELSVEEQLDATNALLQSTASTLKKDSERGQRQLRSFSFFLSNLFDVPDAEVSKLFEVDDENRSSLVAKYSGPFIGNICEVVIVKYALVRARSYTRNGTILALKLLGRIFLEAKMKLMYDWCCRAIKVVRDHYSSDSRVHTPLPAWVVMYHTDRTLQGIFLRSDFALGGRGKDFFRLTGDAISFSFRMIDGEQHMSTSIVLWYNKVTRCLHYCGAFFPITVHDNPFFELFLLLQQHGLVTREVDGRYSVKPILLWPYIFSNGQIEEGVPRSLSEVLQLFRDSGNVYKSCIESQWKKLYNRLRSQILEFNHLYDTDDLLIGVHSGRSSLYGLIMETHDVSAPGFFERLGHSTNSTVAYDHYISNLHMNTSSMDVQVFNGLATNVASQDSLTNPTSLHEKEAAKIHNAFLEKGELYSAKVFEKWFYSSCPQVQSLWLFSKESSALSSGEVAIEDFTNGDEVESVGGGNVESTDGGEESVDGGDSSVGGGDSTATRSNSSAHGGQHPTPSSAPRSTSSMAGIPRRHHVSSSLFDLLFTGSIPLNIHNSCPDSLQRLITEEWRAAGITETSSGPRDLTALYAGQLDLFSFDFHRIVQKDAANLKKNKKKFKPAHRRGQVLVHLCNQFIKQHPNRDLPKCLRIAKLLKEKKELLHLDEYKSFSSVASYTTIPKDRTLSTDSVAVFWKDYRIFRMSYLGNAEWKLQFKEVKIPFDMDENATQAPDVPDWKVDVNVNDGLKKKSISWLSMLQSGLKDEKFTKKQLLRISKNFQTATDSYRGSSKSAADTSSETTLADSSSETTTTTSSSAAAVSPTTTSSSAAKRKVKRKRLQDGSSSTAQRKKARTSSSSESENQGGLFSPSKKLSFWKLSLGESFDVSIPTVNCAFIQLSCGRHHHQTIPLFHNTKFHLKMADGSTQDIVVSIPLEAQAEEERGGTVAAQFAYIFFPSSLIPPVRVDNHSNRYFIQSAIQSKHSPIYYYKRSKEVSRILSKVKNAKDLVPLGVEDSMEDEEDEDYTSTEDEDRTPAAKKKKSSRRSIAFPVLPDPDQKEWVRRVRGYSKGNKRHYISKAGWDSLFKRFCDEYGENWKLKTFQSKVRLYMAKWMRIVEKEDMDKSRDSTLKELEEQQKEQESGNGVSPVVVTPVPSIAHRLQKLRESVVELMQQRSVSKDSRARAFDLLSRIVELGDAPFAGDVEELETECRKLVEEQ